MTEVLIVGAGPTGLTLACLLRQHGVGVRIVDRLDAPTRLAKAMVVWSRSLEILDALGIADQAAAAGIELRAAYYLDGSRRLADVRTNCVPGTRWQPLILPQDTLEDILRRRLAELDCEVDWGVDVADVAPGENSVRATTTAAAGSPVCRSAYVVGCDGLHSRVRESTAIPWRDSAPYEEVFQLGDVEADTDLGRTTVHQFLGRGGVSVAMPMPSGLWRVVGYVDGEKPESVPDRAALQRLLDEVGHEGTTVGRVHWAGTFRVVRRLADDFRAGRVLLAGDAAHVHSPAGGQGLNTGIQDANNLAWKLALVVRGMAGERLLDTYTAERRPIAARIMSMTKLQDRRLFGARSLPSRAARNAALRVGSRSGLIERALVPDLAQVRIRYTGSPLTVRGDRRHGRAYKPGSQIPDVAVVDADGSGPVALRRAEVGGALVLVAAPGRRSAQGILDVESFVAGYPGRLVLRRTVVPLPGTDPRGVGALVGMRPDGYVGYRGPCAATPALRRWLAATIGTVVRDTAGAPGPQDPIATIEAGRQSGQAEHRLGA